MIWSFPRKINLTFGRRAKRLRNIPLAAGEAQEDVTLLDVTVFRPRTGSVRPLRIRRD